MKLILINILKVIIVPLLCVLALNYANFWIIPLVFCGVLIVFNVKEFDSLLSLKFIVVSYVSFIISIFSYGLVVNFLELILDKDFNIGIWNIVDISYLISVGIISPILFFYLNSLYIKKVNFLSNFRKILIGSIIIFFVLILIYSYNIHSDYSFKVWQFVVAVILQYMFVQKDSINSFQTKK